MGLFKKLKKLHKKIDPIGSKVHSKTGGKLEAKVEGKTPLSRMLKGGASNKRVAGSAVTGGSTSATSAVGKVPTKPMQISGKPTGGNSKPLQAGGFNAAGGARLNKLAGNNRLRNRTK